MLQILTILSNINPLQIEILIPKSLFSLPQSSLTRRNFDLYSILSFISLGILLVFLLRLFFTTINDIENMINYIRYYLYTII